jgi:glycosyltransferase involved in cell wall biosynthesis
MSTVLSIVIPAYNEERFIGTLLEQIAAVDLASVGVGKEIVVVDDCSRDRTAEIAAARPHVRLHRQPQNLGKGAAVRAGLALATGDYVIIQDADLEYDPGDYVPMMNAILAGRGDVVYGSRYLGRGRHAGQSWTAYAGGRSLSLACRLCTGTYLTDTVTALKLFPRSVLTSLDLRTSGFELDHEITAKVLARGLTIVEVPVGYHPRSRAEGKKIGARDWLVGVLTFLRFRNG